MSHFLSDFLGKNCMHLGFFMVKRDRFTYSIFTLMLDAFSSKNDRVPVDVNEARAYMRMIR